MAIIKRGRTWVVITYLGRGRQRWRTFGTRREAEFHEARMKLDGAPIAPRRYTVEAYLLEWLEARPKDTATWETYEDVVKGHLIPALGAIPLVRLGPVALEDFVAAQRKRGYAESSIERRIAVLSSALRRAVKRKLIRDNPVALIDRPKLGPSRTPYFDAEQARLFFAALDRSPLGSLLMFMIGTGCRRSEALAVREEDIDGPVVHFRQKVRRDRGRWIFEDTLKTKTSRRTVTMPPFAIDAIRPLIAGRGGLLWHRPDGSPLPGHDVLEELARVCREAGVKYVNMRGLRHSHATLMAHFANAHVLKHRLGHANIRTTYDLYAHAMPGDDAPAAETFDHLLRRPRGTDDVSSR